MLVDSVYEIIKKQGGVKRADCFKQDVTEFIHHDMNTIDPSEQVKMINAYWIDALSVRPKTVDVRNWIQDMYDVDEYIATFKSDWCKLLIDTGIYDG